MQIFIRSKNIIPKIFLFSMALQPLVALLWQQRISFFKLNWLLYPVIVAAVGFYIALEKKAPQMFFALVLVFLLYSLYFLGLPADWEGVFRVFITLMPLTFVGVIQKNDDPSIPRTFWTLYFVAILVPLFISYLQAASLFPYYEFDVDETGMIGRISGGYNKPNNFVAFLFPLYLFGFYRWRIQGKNVQGFIMILFVLAVVYYTGLRTAVAIFVLVFVASFFTEDANKLIAGYYRYYLNFFLGAFGFVIIYFVYQKFGLLDGIRGRIPMWMAHTETFFNSSWIEILTGKGRVLLGPEYSEIKLIGSLEEAHNNTVRTILVFGFVGYFLYCSFIRWLVLAVYRREENSQIKYIRLSCFLFLLLYSITNEPAYYSSILWSVLLGIFPVWELRGVAPKSVVA